MPDFAIAVLTITLIALVAMFVVRSRKADTNPRRRSKQQAKRESVEARGTSRPAAVAPAGAVISNDAPRMPMGDLPPPPDHRRR